MRVRALNVSQGASERWAPAAELGLQVTPLEFELADGFEKTHASTRATELRAVESEAATQGLGVNVSEVRVDECDRVRPGLEAAKLWMMAIAASATLKDLASKERFPPENRRVIRVNWRRIATIALPVQRTGPACGSEDRDSGALRPRAPFGRAKLQRMSRFRGCIQCSVR